MQTHNGTSYRGTSLYASAGLGTGGNQTMNASTGSIPGSNAMGNWEPTVVYLLVLLVLEWAAFLTITKFL